MVSMASPNPLGIDPILLDLGPVQVRWYGLMYVVGFLVSQYLATRLIKNQYFKIPLEKLDTLMTLLFALMFLGARLVYVVVYNWAYYSENLFESLMIWKGGLSFHGALLGLIAAGIIFARQNKLNWIQVMDVVALCGTQGLFFGRVGNFINGELFGRPTDSSIGLVFPGGGPYPRHASQLYEGVLEGILLSLILWTIYHRSKRYGNVSVGFMVGYGLLRFFAEFFREPDTQLGFFLGGNVTMGQILCFLMAAFGVGLFFWVKNKNLLIETH